MEDPTGLLGPVRGGNARAGTAGRGAEAWSGPTAGTFGEPRRVAPSHRESELVVLNAWKHAGNLLQEGTRPERLGEHRTGHIPVSGNAGEEQYGRRRLEAGKAGGKFDAA